MKTWKFKETTKKILTPHCVHQVVTLGTRLNNLIHDNRKQHSVVQMTISLKIIKWLQNDLAPDRVKEPASQLNKNRIEDKCVQFRGSCTNIRIQKVKECYFQWTIRTRQKESYMNESNDCSQLKRVIETTEYLNKKPRFLPGGGGGTSLYKPYRNVPPHRVGFLRRFALKTGIDFAHFGLESGMVFEGTTECMTVLIVSIPN